jgi:membrane protein YdbS with pleckstrin-like domain
MLVDDKIDVLKLRKKLPVKLLIIISTFVVSTPCIVLGLLCFAKKLDFEWFDNPLITVALFLSFGFVIFSIGLTELVDYLKIKKEIKRERVRIKSTTIDSEL